MAEIMEKEVNKKASISDNPENDPGSVLQTEILAAYQDIPRGTGKQQGPEGKQRHHAGKPVIPVLGVKPDSFDQPSDELIAELRRFHLGDPDAASNLPLPEDDLLPALLNPYRDIDRFRYEYPLYLGFSPDKERDAGESQSAEGAKAFIRPLNDFLQASVASFAPGEESARILKDNLPWIENNLYDQVSETSAPLPACVLLMRAFDDLKKHLSLSGANLESLQKDLDSLAGCFSEKAQLLGYSPEVAFHLLHHVVAEEMAARQEVFSHQLLTRARRLEQLLEVEKEKSPEANAPETVKGRVGEAEQYFDKTSLSDVLEHRHHGAVAMSTERLARISGILAALQDYKAPDDPLIYLLPDDGSRIPGEAGEHVVINDDPLLAALDVYNKTAQQMASVFSAARMADLEIEDRYDARLHDSWFEGFDWEAFSAEELKLLPLIVVVDSAERIAANGLKSLSRLLSSGKPIQVLAWVHAHGNPGAETGEDPLNLFRLELAYFGIGHRQAFINQVSASRHEHLLGGFNKSLESMRTGLHLINTGYKDGFERRSEPPVLNPWLMASAALESRSHPFIQLCPEATGGARTEFLGNPHSEQDWATNHFTYQAADGRLIEIQAAFSFADYCLLHDEFRRHFRKAPDGYESENLVCVDEILFSDADSQDKKLPFVWAVDDAGELHRLIISRELMLSCRDRQNFWRALQALAGVRNEHIDRAVASVRETERAMAEERIKVLQESHAAELEQVKNEAAEKVMGQLADVLLGMDISSLSSVDSVDVNVSGNRLVPSATDNDAGALLERGDEHSDVKEVDEAELPASAEVAEDISFNEPWIDSIFCTSCDDCMGINAVLFVYNDNKQAVISDPAKGTYAELVRAAELCPAKCIHPGKPLNPDESGLEELIKRAEPFN